MEIIIAILLAIAIIATLVVILIWCIQAIKWLIKFISNPKRYFEKILEIYDKVDQFVIQAGKGNQNDIRHAQRTAYWVKQLKPEADEALLVAALAHDIERAIYGDWKKGTDDLAALRKHQDLSALEIEKFLQSQNVSAEFIERVKNLVAHHEEGGDDDQNVLCDADCLSFFEDKAVRRVKKWKEEGKSSEEMKKNMDFYFSRIVSPRAKDIAQKWYDAALQEISN